jgi:hypothetical protein
MFMTQPSNAHVDLDHIEDILDMVAQRMAACCAHFAGASTGALKTGMVLVGDAFLVHGRATGLSEVSVTNLNSISVSDKLSPTAHQE